MSRLPLLAACLAIALCVFAPGRAEAALGDGTDPGYLARFPSAPAAGSILCVELFRFTVSTPSGPREIRGIQDVAGGWAPPPGAAAGLERGARAAADAMASLGSYTTDDITLLLLDDAFSLAPGARPIAAITDGARDAGPRTLRFAGFHTGDSPDELQIEIERRRSCDPCAGSDRVDACLAGSGR